MSSLLKKNINFMASARFNNVFVSDYNNVSNFFTKHISDVGIELNKQSIIFIINSDEKIKIILLENRLKYEYSLEDTNGSIEVNKAKLIGIKTETSDFRYNSFSDTTQYKTNHLELSFENEKLNFNIDINTDGYMIDKKELQSQLLNLIK